MVIGTPEHGNAAMQQEADSKTADQPAATGKMWDKRKLLEKLDKNTKTLLQIEEMHQRLVKAREFVENGSVQRVRLVRNHYVVDDNKNGVFLVNNDRCDCDGALSRFSAIKGWCEHRTATELFKRDVE